MATKKVEICLKKKNPPRAQIFRHFRIESPNNKTSENSELTTMAIFQLFTFFQ